MKCEDTNDSKICTYNRKIKSKSFHKNKGINLYYSVNRCNSAVYINQVGFTGGFAQCVFPRTCTLRSNRCVPLLDGVPCKKVERQVSVVIFICIRGESWARATLELRVHLVASIIAGSKRLVKRKE